jgi:SAM-dependent methyltransferase
VQQGVPILLDPESTAAIAATRGRAENVHLRQSLGRSPGLLRLVDRLRPPHPFAYMRRRVSRAQRAAFSRLASAAGERDGAIFLDVGSGILGGLNASGLSDYVTQHTVPLEIAPTSGVGVVGDAHKLPFADASLDGVLIQGVLEHVADPERIVAEIRRVLRPGAPVFAEVPFIQHYHLDPVDYRRWTHFGFADLFRDFEVVDAGVCAGPASALTDVLTEFPALVFSSPKLYWGVKAVAGWVFAPLQLLDVLWARCRGRTCSPARCSYSAASRRSLRERAGRARRARHGRGARDRPRHRGTVGRGGNVGRDDRHQRRGGARGRR